MQENDDNGSAVWGLLRELIYKMQSLGDFQH